MKNLSNNNKEKDCITIFGIIMFCAGCGTTILVEQFIIPILKCLFG